MGISESGTTEYERMIDFMREDLTSGMQHTKLEMATRKLLESQGRDFDEEFAKWKENKGV